MTSLRSELRAAVAEFGSDQVAVVRGLRSRGINARGYWDHRGPARNVVYIADGHNAGNRHALVYIWGQGIETLAEVFK